MESRGIELFLALSRTLHYGQTGKQCGISTSALSRYIQRMEDELGEALFIRGRQGVSLTEAGRIFHRYAVEEERIRTRMLGELMSIREKVTGSLRLYCSVTALYGILPDIIIRFRTKFPEVHLEILTGAAYSSLEKLYRDETDIAVAALPERLSADLLFKSLTSTPLVFIGPRKPCQILELINQKERDWSQIPLILGKEGLARERTEQWFRERNISPLIHAEVSGNEAIIALVSLGVGVGVVPRMVIEKSPMKEDIVTVETEENLEPYDVGVCMKKSLLILPQAKAFWEGLS